MEDQPIPQVWLLCHRDGLQLDTSLLVHPPLGAAPQIPQNTNTRPRVNKECLPAQDRGSRTDDAFERFTRYDRLVEQDPTFRDAVGVTAPTSSLLAEPPKVGNWQVNILDPKSDPSATSAVKSSSQSVRAFPGGATVKSALSSSVVLAGSSRRKSTNTSTNSIQQVKTRALGTEHSYDRPPPNALPDKRIAPKLVSKSSLRNVARVLPRNPLPGDASLSLSQSALTSLPTQSMQYQVSEQFLNSSTEENQRMRTDAVVRTTQLRTILQAMACFLSYLCVDIHTRIYTPALDIHACTGYTRLHYLAGNGMFSVLLLCLTCV
jgi:hypothetical protein